MSAPTYRQEDLVRQPIGFWSGEAYRRVAEAIRGSLAGLATADGDWITMTAAGSERRATATGGPTATC